MTTETPVAPPEVQRPLVADTNTNERTQQPPMYAVVLLNDNTTSPMFVIEVLSEVFGLDGSKATRIMMAAHRSGKAMVQTYTKEVAETRLNQAQAIINERGVNSYDPSQACELKFDLEPQSGADNDR